MTLRICAACRRAWDRVMGSHILH